MKLSDLVHIVFGFLAGFIWEISTACTLLYVVYQWREPEKLREKLRDFIEYGIGLAIGAVTRMLIYQ